MLSRLAHTKSHAAVTSHVTRIAAAMDLPGGASATEWAVMTGRLCTAASPQGPAGIDARRLVVVEHDLAVDPHGTYADGRILRVAEIRAVGNRRRIEEDQIGEVVRRDQSALDDAGIRGREARHLADRFFDREQ